MRSAISLSVSFSSAIILSKSIVAPTITFSSIAVTEDSGNNITHLVYVYHSLSAQDSKLDGVVALCYQLIEKGQGVNRIITTPSERESDCSE